MCVHIFPPPFLRLNHQNEFHLSCVKRFETAFFGVTKRWTEVPKLSSQIKTTKKSLKKVKRAIAVEPFDAAQEFPTRAAGEGISSR